MRLRILSVFLASLFISSACGTGAVDNANVPAAPSEASTTLPSIGTADPNTSPPPAAGGSGSPASSTGGSASTGGGSSSSSSSSGTTTAGTPPVGTTTGLSGGTATGTTTIGGTPPVVPAQPVAPTQPGNPNNPNAGTITIPIGPGIGITIPITKSPSYCYDEDLNPKGKCSNSYECDGERVCVDSECTGQARPAGDKSCGKDGSKDGNKDH